MTAQPAAVELAHPPRALLRAVNPMLRLALRAPIIGSALHELMVVSFAGRKTSRRFSVPVTAHRIDGDLYVLLTAGWKHNFRDGAPATVLHDGKTTSMQGQLIDDPAAVAEFAHRVTVASGAKKAQRLMGLKFREDAIPSVADFAEASKRLGLAAIRLVAD